MRINEPTEGSVSGGEPSFISQGVWLRSIGVLDSIKDTIDCFLNEMSRYLKSGGIVYFKYTPAYRTFVASRKVNLNMDVDIQGLGIELLEQKGEWSPDALRFPEKLEEFSHFVRQVFSVQEYSTLCLENDGEIKGIFLFLEREGVREDPYISSCLHFLSLKVFQIDMKKKLNNMTVYDMKTHVLNRRHFLKRLTEEVYRGRRIHWPVSLLIINIDCFDRYIEEISQEGVDMLLKMLAVIMRKNSRVNDITGKMSSDEFGIILPHTLAKGAVIQAERLRNIVESADFSKVLPELSDVTVSFGVSEYPSLCKNMDGLLESAGRALSRSMKTSGNKVFLARTPEGFIPDFVSSGDGKNPV